MKVAYKGFDIDAHRRKSAGGDTLLFFFVHRKSDGYEVTAGYSYGSDKIRDFIKYLKDIVDDFLEDPQAYYRGYVGDDEPEIDDDAEPPEISEDEQ